MYSLYLRSIMYGMSIKDLTGSIIITNNNVALANIYNTSRLNAALCTP